MAKVLWFREEAKVSRWREEVQLLEAEIKRSKLFFEHCADVWRANIDANPESIEGFAANAFCWKQVDVYNRMRGKCYHSFA